MRCAMIKLMTPLDCARRRRRCARTRDQRENTAAAAQYYTLYMQTTRCLLLGRSLEISPAYIPIERERKTICAPRPPARGVSPSGQGAAAAAMTDCSSS